MEPEVEMSGNKAGKSRRKDFTIETAKLLAQMAERGDLTGMLNMTADYFEARAKAGGVDAMSGEPIKPLPVRWPAYGISLPLRDKRRRSLKDADLATLYWAFSLVIALHRAMDGGHHARIYLTAGRRRRAPSDAAVLAAADLIKRSGLRVRLGRRRPDARLITVRH